MVEPEIYDIELMLKDLRNRICKRRRRTTEGGISRRLDIFGGNRVRLMVKKEKDAVIQPSDIRSLIEKSTDKKYVEGGISPLSPLNTDLLFFNDDTSSSSMVYFEWSCKDCPLYLPKLCKCTDKHNSYALGIANTRSHSDSNIEQKNFLVRDASDICSHDGCGGLTYMPFSFIQISLNRLYNSVESFISANKGLPESLNIFYGKLKNSLLLVTSDKNNENEVFKSLQNISYNLGYIVVYDIILSNSSKSPRRPYTTKFRLAGLAHELID
ncbi:hypothetical protein ACR3K2_17320 [Cryptosporidium serpentis]